MTSDALDAPPSTRVRATDGPEPATTPKTPGFKSFLAAGRGWPPVPLPRA